MATGGQAKSHFVGSVKPVLLVCIIHNAVQDGTTCMTQMQFKTYIFLAEYCHVAQKTSNESHWCSGLADHNAAYQLVPSITSTSSVSCVCVCSNLFGLYDIFF